jgi:hypothetical protein
VKEVHYKSPLEPEALLARITEGADPAKFLSFSFGKKLIRINLDRTHFKLEKKRNYRNSFAPIFDGQVTKTNDGSQVVGGFRMTRFASVFMTIWMSFAAIFAVIFYVQFFSGKTSAGSRLWLIQPIGMLVFGAILPKFGWWLGRNELIYIDDYLKACCRNAAVDE